jgi:hypothetical protein
MGGTIFEYGALAPELTCFPLFKALSKGPSVRRYTLSEVLFDPKLKLEAEKYVFDQVEAGKKAHTPKHGINGRLKPNVWFSR